ncbi:MAG: hypothetical protein JSR85_04220 [Proteobacteria bacterium]|nr:hypothetical protein [Pseudomonadota bacterium]
MKKENDIKNNKSSKNLKISKNKKQTFEERKRIAYAAMGRLGGLARAKQMGEEGFTSNNTFKEIQKKIIKTILDATSTGTSKKTKKEVLK